MGQVIILVLTLWNKCPNIIRQMEGYYTSRGLCTQSVKYAFLQIDMLYYFVYVIHLGNSTLLFLYDELH